MYIHAYVHQNIHIYGIKDTLAPDSLLTCLNTKFPSLIYIYIKEILMLLLEAASHS